MARLWTGSTACLLSDGGKCCLFVNIKQQVTVRLETKQKRSEALVFLVDRVATHTCALSSLVRPASSPRTLSGMASPTIDFQLGREGRKADEGTFLPTDHLVAEGQQDALNPNIIPNRVCDQLVNICEANDAAVAACEDAHALVEQLGTHQGRVDC
ncbi:hypothetical protein diail_2535 [Diaporthe ilicicola]|nr:hypothetical protein diail_2535 [Diaporthe ilicicola]